MDLETIYKNKNFENEYSDTSEATKNLKKLVNLLDHPISKNQTKRQLQFYDNYLKLRRGAIHLQDFPDLIQLFVLTIDKLDSEPKFACNIECIFKILLKKPILMDKSSDLYYYAKDFEEFFSTLGYLIVYLKNDNLNDLVYDIIDHFLTKKPRSHPISLKDFHQAAENSRLPDIFGQLLEVIEDEYYPRLIKISLKLAEVSDKACIKMVKERAVASLVHRLDPNWQTHNNDLSPAPKYGEDIENLTDLIKLFRLLLNHCDGYERFENYCLHGLEYAFRLSIIYNREHDRNNILAILLKIMLTYRKLEMLTSLADDILISFTTINNTRDPNEFINFNLMMVPLLPYCLENCLLYFKSYQVMRHLLDLLDNPFVECDQIDVIKLKIIILLVLPKLLPDLADDFNIYNGPQCLVNIVQYEPLTLACLQCLTQIIDFDDEDITESLKQHQLFSIVFDIVKHFIKNNLNEANQGILINSCLILQYLYKPKSCNEYVEFSINFFNRILNPCDDDFIINDNVVISAVDFFWTFLPKNLENFIKSGGIYSTLDLLYLFSDSVAAKIILNFLNDIAYVSSYSIPFMITWRKNGKDIVLHLLQLFDNNDELKPKIHALLHIILHIHKETVEIADDNYKIMKGRNKLNINEQITFLLVENYLTLEIGHTWISVAMDLKNVKLIDDDYIFLEKMINACWNLSDYLQHSREEIIRKEIIIEDDAEYELYRTLNESRLAQSLNALNEIGYIAKCTEKIFGIAKTYQKSIDIERSLGLLVEEFPQLNIRSTELDLLITNVHDQVWVFNTGIKDNTYLFNPSNKD